MSAILVVTGASGAGKTAAVHALAARALDGVRCFFFDSIGVPEGADEAWRTASTQRWLAELDALDGVRIAVLDGQVPPSVLFQVARGLRRRVHVVLLDCERAVRDARLDARGQPELATETMACWAAYLRGQADALGLVVIDTTALVVDEVAARLAGVIRELAVERAS